MPEDSEIATKTQTLLPKGSIAQMSRPHLAMERTDTKECEHVNGFASFSQANHASCCMIRTQRA